MPVPGTITLTLKGVYDLIGTLPDLSKQKRSTLRSSVSRFCQVCGKTPGEVIADPAVIRRLHTEAAWQQARIEKLSWANLKSSLTAAMVLAGVKVHRSRRNFKLSPSWGALLASMDEMARRDLRRFAGWCTTHSIAPDEVDARVFADFLSHLETESVQRHPRERWHVARRAWNKLGAIHPNLPVIDNIEQEGWRGLSWEAFPQSLRDEISTYAARVTKSGPGQSSSLRQTIERLEGGERPAKAIKAITLHGYLANLRRYLSRLADDGYPIEEMTTLRWCIEPDRVVRGLELLLGDRDLRDERTRPSLHAMMTAILSVAHFVKVEEATLERLRYLADEVRHRPTGMSPRNLARLAALRAPELGKKLYGLPFRVAERLTDVDHPTIRQAQDMQLAVLLAVLSHLPLRIGSAVQLDLDKHFLRPLAGKKGSWVLHLPASAVKNEKAIEGEFTERVSELLEVYCVRFRPVLLKSPTSALFISQTGAVKGPHTLGKQFSKFIKREIGLTFNPHLIRHYTAFVYLAAHPGDYETVRQLLGHKNIKTTITFYAGTDTAAALKSWSHVISDQLIEHPVISSVIGHLPPSSSLGFEDRL